MKIVIDTNIVFSGLLSPNGKVADIIINSEDIFLFYTPSYLLDELENHTEKLLKISGYSVKELNFLKRIIFRKINFIDMEIISKSSWIEAIDLTSDVDEFDSPFVALALELGVPLWTGDKKLSLYVESCG